MNKCIHQGNLGKPGIKMVPIYQAQEFPFVKSVPYQLKLSRIQCFTVIITTHSWSINLTHLFQNTHWVVVVRQGGTHHHWHCHLHPRSCCCVLTGPATGPNTPQLRILQQTRAAPSSALRTWQTCKRPRQVFKQVLLELYVCIPGQFWPYWLRTRRCWSKLCSLFTKC